MGMYDTIVVNEYPLPMPEDPKGYICRGDFQTKSLENSLATYKIEKDGTLWIEQYESKHIPGNPNSKSIFETIGHFEVTKRWWEFVPTTVTIEFYDYIQSENTDYDYSIDYTAEFLKGKLLDVKLTKFEALCNKERKKRDAEYDARHKAWYDFTQTKKYKYFYKPYSTVVKFILKKIRSVLSYALCNFHKIENFFKV